MSQSVAARHRASPGFAAFSGSSTDGLRRSANKEHEIWNLATIRYASLNAHNGDFLNIASSVHVLRWKLLCGLPNKIVLE